MEPYLIHIYPRRWKQCHINIACVPHAKKKKKRKWKSFFRKAVAASGFTTSAESKNHCEKVPPKVCGVASTVARPFTQPKKKTR